MIKKVAFPIVIISAIFLSACTTKTPLTEENTMDGNAPQTESEQSSKTSMRDLLGMGKNQKCTITMSDTDKDGVKTDTQGTLYISGKKLSEDITVTSTDKEMPQISMRMISDGTYMYTWNLESKSQGMKFKITEPAEVEDKTDNDQTSGSVNLDEKVDMKCSSWSVDESKFAIPKDVQFSDLSEMMKNIPTMPANIPTGE